MSEERVLPELDIPDQNHNPGVCDCDLVGGDEACKIQPPYLSGLERWRMALKQRENELRTTLASLAQSEAERERLRAALEIAVDDISEIDRGARYTVEAYLAAARRRITEAPQALLEDKSKPVATTKE